MISIFTTLYFLSGPEGPFSPAGGLFAHIKAPSEAHCAPKHHYFGHIVSN